MVALDARWIYLASDRATGSFQSICTYILSFAVSYLFKQTFVLVHLFATVTTLMFVDP